MCVLCVCVCVCVRERERERRRDRDGERKTDLQTDLWHDRHTDRRTETTLRTLLLLQRGNVRDGVVNNAVVTRCIAWRRRRRRRRLSRGTVVNGVVRLISEVCLQSDVPRVALSDSQLWGPAILVSSQRHAV